MSVTTTGVRCGRPWLGLLVAALLFGWSMGADNALAAPASRTPPVVVPAPIDVTPHAVQSCCAGAWYPWGWHSTRAKCTAAGKDVLATVAVALSYKCSYVTHPPASANGRHYHLYVFEAT